MRRVKRYLWKQLIVKLILVGLFLQGCGGSTGGTSSSSSTTGGASGGATVTAPSDMAVGDIFPVSLSGGSASINFANVSSGSKFELILQSQATSGGSVSYVLSDSEGIGKSLVLDDVVEELIAEEIDDPAADFHQMLRLEEETNLNEAFYGGEEPVATEGVGKSVAKGIGPAISVGTKRDFIVLDSLTDVTRTVTVTATAKCVNSEVAVYVDNEILTTNPNDLPDSDIDSLCVIYETGMPSLDTWFGANSDIDNNGVIIALITSQVNKLTSGSGGIITGFFYSGDLFGYNLAEIVYMSTPDSAGVYGTAVSNSFSMSNFLPAVLFHEVQHLKSYYQHTVVAGGVSEENWLNEGMSHLTEDLVGYNRENYSRYSLYLNSPQSYNLVTTSSPGLAQRGGSYLFMRYLYEQSGKSTSFLQRLLKTGKTGTTNVVAAFNGSDTGFDDMGDFLLNWGIALAYTNRGLTSNSRYTYQMRTLNSTTGNYMGVCMICVASDGRGTFLSGPNFGSYSSNGSYALTGGSSRFLSIGTTPTSIQITAGSSSSPTAVLLRIK